MNIRNLIVEVTRKCNMYCDHCLRGEPINVNMKKEYIDLLLDQVDNIGSVVFTGGTVFKRSYYGILFGTM